MTDHQSFVKGVCNIKVRIFGNVLKVGDRKHGSRDSGAGGDAVRDRLLSVLLIA